MYNTRTHRKGTQTGSKRAIGIIRVSQVGGREGEAFHSPDVQRERIEGICRDHKWRAATTFEELDESGRLPLARRTGLLPAVQAIEAKQAQVLVVAYFDRLCREPSVRDEVVDRVEAAGGEVWCADMGRTSNGTAAQKFTGGMLALASRFVLESSAEKARAAQAEAVQAGTWMAAHIPPGYRREAVGTNAKGKPIYKGPLLRDSDTAPVVAEAFRLRAEGATIEDVQLYLREHGIERTYKAIGKLLHSRVVLGEVHFGDLHNLSAHPAIVDPETWKRVQRASAPRGVQAESGRLLARLGVLRCGTCGSRMSVTTSNYHYPAYRCGQAEYCKRRVTISAELAEQTVVRATRDALADVKGRASAEGRRREAAGALATADANLQAAFRAFAGMEGEAGARERLQELREARDKAQAHLDSLGGLGTVVTFSPTAEWDRLAVDEQRAFISATIASATVAPGRGSDRIEIILK